VLGTIEILTASSSEMLVFIRQTKGVTSGEIVVVILKYFRRKVDLFLSRQLLLAALQNNVMNFFSGSIQDEVLEKQSF
jgi:hypothetical protein